MTARAATGDTVFIQGQWPNYPHYQFSQEEQPSLSADGRYLAVGSTQWDLFSPNNYKPQIYVFDIQTGLLEIVSVHTDGTIGNEISWGSSISADGRWVAFISEADNLTNDDTNGIRDIFLHDRVNSTTVRITPDPGPGNTITRPYSALQLNGSGKFLVFASESDHLSPDDSNGSWDIYVYDVDAEQFKLISQDSTGAAAGAQYRYGTSISSNGRVVSFTSRAANIVNGVGNGKDQVYVRDHIAGVTELVSVTLTGGLPWNGAWVSSLNPDGTLVVFAAEGNGLVSDNVNGKAQVYLRDRTTGTTELISVNNINEAGDDHADIHIGRRASARVISDDGRFVLFNSDAANLVAGQSVSGSAYVRDRVNGTTRIISISTDGSKVSNADQVSISGGGRYVVFQSWKNLEPGIDYDDCCQEQLYVHDLGPTEPAEMIDEIIDSIVGLDLNGGLSNSLESKLETALDALLDVNENNDVAACNSLNAMINSINAQTPGKITPDEAMDLIKNITAVMAEIPCE
jgi:Tol biopolymer transport system component